MTEVSFPGLTLSDYDQVPVESVLTNNGHSVKLATTSSSQFLTPKLSGGALPGSYNFAQVHFHWGGDDTRGSEHLVDNQAYPMEMHLVHYKDTNKDIGAALSKGSYDSLAVLGIFFQARRMCRRNYF